MSCILYLNTDVFSDNELFHICYQQMSENRREKINRLRFDRDKRLSLGSGILLDMALHKAGLCEKTARISLTTYEKPFLSERQDINFNLSHSGHFSACAIAKQPIGIDIEKIETVDDNLILYVCTSEEAKRIIPTGVCRNDKFFNLWTVKESYMKLLGTGLSLSPERLETEYGQQLFIRQDGIVRNVAFFQVKIDGYWLTVCTKKAEPIILEKITAKDIYGLYSR